MLQPAQVPEHRWKERAQRAWRAVSSGHAALLLLIGAAALAVRLHRLGEESLWIDEAIAYGRARLPLDELLADSIERKHLPTYFLLLKATLLIGDSEAMLRLPSVLFGTISVLLCYGLGATLHGRLAGFTAAMLAMLSEAQVYYAQEARMYALLTMATSTALLGTFHLVKHCDEAALAPRALFREEGARGARMAWLAVLLGTVLALFSHNTAPLFVLALNGGAAAGVLGSGRHRAGFARNWLVCMAIAFVAWSPWIPTLLRQTKVVSEVWKGHDPTLEWTSSVMLDLFALGRAGGPLAHALIGCALLSCWSLRRDRRLLATALLCTFIAPLLFYVVSQRVEIFDRRLLLWTALPWFALVGAGLTALPRPIAALGCAALIAVAVPRLTAYYAAETKPPWRMLLYKLAEKTDDDSVILNAKADRFTYYYYKRTDERVPRRKTIRAQNRQRPLKGYVGDADEFYVIAQPSSRAFKELTASISADGRYRRSKKWGKGDAALLRYRRKR